MKSMLCPKHNISMLTRQSGDVQFECCSTCNGVWFGPAHLATLDLPREFYPKSLRTFALAKGIAPAFGAARCHQCQKSLRIATIEGVSVNICPSCGGAWLNASEFDRVLAWYNEQRKKKDTAGGDFDAGPSDLFDEAKTPRFSSQKEGCEDAEVPVSPSLQEGAAEEGIVSALIEYLSAVCRGVGEVLSGLGDAASAIGDSLGDADFD